MLPDQTNAQIAALSIDRERPLLICDVDEVVVHFTRAFEVYIGEQDLWLDTRSFALNGNIRRRGTGEELAQFHVGQLIGSFFVERTEHLEAIEGAIEWLIAIGKVADVVMLSNLPHDAAEARRRNFERHGLHYPLVTNAGPKGPAVKAIASDSKGPVAFIDDSPSFLTSAHEYFPRAQLIHFLHDERFARHLTPLPFVSLTTDRWSEAGPHIMNLLTGP
jgi:hypothetical protein